MKMEELPDGSLALKINEVRPDDAGKYTAEVSNDKGTSSSSVKASVLGMKEVASSR